MIGQILESIRRNRQKAEEMENRRAQRNLELMKLKREIRDGVQAYDAVVKHNGKRVTLNSKPMTKSAAKGLAKYNVDNSIATEYELVKRKDKAGLSSPNNMLRWALRSKFNGTVEKERYRYDSFGEKAGLTPEDIKRKRRFL
jgi:hypothetical protein